MADERNFDVNKLTQFLQNQPKMDVVPGVPSMGAPLDYGKLEKFLKGPEQPQVPMGQAPNPSAIGTMIDALQYAGVKSLTMTGKGVNRMRRATDRAFFGASPEAEQVYASQEEWLQGLEDAWKLNYTPEQIQAIRDTQITGDLFSPSTWDFGKNPNLYGYALQAADVFGQYLPPMLVTLLTRNPSIMTVTGGAGAVDDVAQTIEGYYDELWKSGQMYNQLPKFRELVDNDGMSDWDAYQVLKKKSADVGGLLAFPIGALTDTVVGDLALGKLGKSVTGALVKGGAVEGLGEASEIAAGTLGSNIVSGDNRNPYEGTLGEFVFGAIGGSVAAGGGRLINGPEEQKPTTNPGDIPQALIEAGVMDPGGMGNIPNNAPTSALVTSPSAPSPGGSDGGSAGGASTGNFSQEELVGRVVTELAKGNTEAAQAAMAQYVQNKPKQDDGLIAGFDPKEFDGDGDLIDVESVVFEDLNDLNFTPEVSPQSFYDAQQKNPYNFENHFGPAQIELFSEPFEGQLAPMGLTYVGPKKGSAKGGIYQDAQGYQFLVKQYPDPKMAEQETISNDLLMHFGGIDAFVPATQVIPVANGQNVFVSKMLQNMVPFDPQNEDHVEAAKKDFAVNAWMANWDVFGAEWDNILVSPAGELFYVDTGGSLEYRAQGEKKGLKFGNTVPEVQSFFDPKTNPKTAQIYGGLTNTEMVRQIIDLAYNVGEAAKTGDLLDRFKGNVKLYQKMVKRALDMLNQTNMSLLEYPEFYGDKYINKFNDATDSLNDLILDFKDTKTSDGPLKINLKKSATSMQKSITQVVREAMDYNTLNQDFIYSFTKDPHMASFSESPYLYGLLIMPEFNSWIKGNKLWWDQVNMRMAYKDFGDMSLKDIYLTHKFLPPILFHGVANQHVKAEYNQELDTYTFFTKYEKKSGNGGGDTHLGMFLEVNPKQAAAWAGEYTNAPGQSASRDWYQLYQHKVIPFAASFKKPYVLDYQGKNWNTAYHVPLAEAAKAKGYDAFIIHNIKDKGIGTQIIVFDPNNGMNLKSPFSKSFDPKVKSFASTINGEPKKFFTLTELEKKRLHNEMKKLLPEGLVDLRFFPLKGNRQGVFSKDMRGWYIGLSTSMPTKSGFMGVLRHEVIHAMRTLGFFRSTEGQKMWKILVNAVKANGISQHTKDNYARADWIEETIAQMAEQYTTEQLELEAKSPVAKALKAIKDFWAALGNWSRGLGFRTADDVLSYIFSGNFQRGDFELEPANEMRDFVQKDSLMTKAALVKLGLKNAELPEHSDHFNKVVKYGWNVVQLGKKNLHLPWLQRYIQRAEQWYAEKSKWQAMANETVAEWNKLSTPEQKALTQYLFAMEHMEYLTPQERNKGVVRKPTQAEIVALGQKYGMTQPAMQVFVRVANDFQQVLDRMEKAAVDSITKSLQHDPFLQIMEVNNAKKAFAELRKKPYFPHSRFGSYTVVVKDTSGKTVYMEAFESEKARNKAYLKIMKDYPQDQGFKTSMSKLTDAQKVYQGIPHALLVSMRQSLNLTPAQQKDLDVMITHTLPAMSFKNHFAHKNNVAGYSEDALRAYADYFWHAGNHIARLEFSPLMQDEISAGNQDIAAQINQGGTDTTKRREIVDYLENHFESIMNPKPDWAGMRQGGFIWYLGFNVKSALVNFLQVPMASWSYLAANFGDVGAAAKLGKNMKFLKTMFRSPQKAASQVTPLYGKMLMKGVEMGFLDESFAAELAGLAEGGNLNIFRAQSATRKMILRFNEAAGYMFSTVEKLNRRVTFMAAVELAMDADMNSDYMQNLRTRFEINLAQMIQEGWSEREALAFLAGKDAVDSTQFNYQSWARPRVMQGRKSAFLMFFMFTQNMLWFIQNSPGNSRYLLLLLLFAGLKGMPGAEDAEELVKAAGHLMHKDWDPERELREVMLEWFGDEGRIDPDLILHGISRYGFGLKELGDLTGVPLPSVDLSGSIGMGSPLPVISPAIRAGGKLIKTGDLNEALGQFTAEGVGPLLSIPISILKVLSDSQMETDNMKRWEPAMPTAISSISRAIRYYKTGQEETRNGGKIVDFDRNNPEHMAEIIARGMGFNPTRVTETWDRLIMQREAEAFWFGRRDAILDAYDDAKRKGNAEKMKEVKAALNRYNQTVPFKELKILPKTLERSLKSRQTARDKTEQNRPNSKMMEPVYEDIRKLFPKITTEPVKGVFK